MRNLNDLLEEAKNGSLSNNEISYLAENIEKHQNGDDPGLNLYTLIHALGRADVVQTQGKHYSPPRGTEYRELIESFIDYPDDPEISCIALKTICTYWGYTSDYLEDIKQFIKGVDWDDDYDVFLIAVSIAGEYLRSLEEMDQELLSFLIEAWERFRSEDPSGVESEMLYKAIARASGKEWNEIVGQPWPDPKIIDNVHSMLKEKK